MDKKITSIKQLKGTKVYKGKKIPHSVGKIRDIVFLPHKNQVAGFLTKRGDFLLMFKRRGHFVSINGYYLYEDLAFVKQQKGMMDRPAYKALGVKAKDCICWLNLPVITEEGEDVGVITDVFFAHFTGEVHSVKVTLGAMGKLTQSSRLIPADLIVGYNNEASTALMLTDADSDKKGSSQFSAGALIVANEALDIEVESSVAAKAGKKVTQAVNDAGLDTTAVSEKAKSVAATAGSIAKSGAVATGRQIAKTKGMFSDFKDAFNEAKK